MMGAGSKRKLCGGGSGGGGVGKVGRWEESSLARLQAVAVPGEGWADERAECGCWRGPRPWPYAQETIRCAENGKSYLELGSGGWARRRCCARQCHRERRLKVMNLCVVKLSRFRQSADPSLRRSVLVCNTLRRMEREAEREAAEEAARAPRSPPAPLPPLGAPGRATPFPAPPADADSGYGDEECARPIDWGSVLSLSSQSALDPLNNNEPSGWPDSATLPLDEAGATSWGAPLPLHEERPPDPDLDGFMHILVGQS